MVVKVINDNVHPYTEKWRGQVISIPPKGYIEMDINDAHLFIGTMQPNIEVDGNGIPKPTSYKMLRIEKFGANEQQRVVEVKKYICHACGKDMVNAEAYIEHVEGAHLQALEDQDLASEIVKKRGRKKGVAHDTNGDRDSSTT